VELCIGYCNIVLLSRRRLPPGSYKKRHRLLVSLILAEHNPIIQELVEGPWISDLIKEFRKEKTNEQWQDDHIKLAT